MNEADGNLILFEGYALDLRRGCLRRGDDDIELRPKCFELLRYLVENAGRLLSKDELIQALWPNVIVTDDSLTRCISDVRRAVRDDGHRIIKTILRRGYLFAAPVSLLAPQAPPKEGDPAVSAFVALPADAAGEVPPAALARNEIEADHRPPGEEAIEHGPAGRRQLTVLACDLVGAAERSAKLDPEDLSETLLACYACFTEIIERYHGFVARCSSDGLLAYFGYPQAHEHETERAVCAGLALVEAVPKLRVTADMPMQVRIGIATGPIVVGEVVRVGAPPEQTILGEAPNLAARLQAMAEAGTVIVSSDSRKLTGGLFHYRCLGAVPRAAADRDVFAWQVLGASEIESRFEAFRSTATPLVGRAEEIDLLLRRWEQAKTGEGSVVLVSGEAGIGKSRIADALLARVRGDRHIRMRNFCSPHHQDSALHPSIMQLARASGLRRDDADQQKLAKIEAVLSLSINDFSEAGPVAADLLSIPTGDRYPPLITTPQKRKEIAFWVQQTQIEELARRQPLLILYEDVHWSDPMTLESLDLLVDRVPGLAVLVIITFRPEFAPPWIGRPHVSLLSLNRLPLRERAEMITHVAGGRVLPKEIVAEITERTDGVPLFVEELTKSVVESGLLVQSGDQYVLSDPLTPRAIPISLQASLLARLDRLGSAREIVQIAAALGRRFSHELIAAMAPMPPSQLGDALAQIVRAELIYRRGTPPDAEYTFKHALVQDAAYGTLLRGQRQQLHARIVATLEDHFPETVAAQPEQLAQHCVAAGLVEKAIPHWLAAGRQALARSAMPEAKALFHRGLDLLAGTPDNPRRREQELELRIALGQALAFTKGPSADNNETRMRAVQLAKQIDRPPYMLWLYCTQSAFHLFRSEHRLSLSLAEQTEEIGAATNDVAAELWGRCAIGTVKGLLGEFGAARAQLERCHDLADPRYRETGPGFSSAPYASMLANQAVMFAYLGYVDQARSGVNQALAEASRIGHARARAEVLVYTTWADWVTASPELAPHAEELLALASDHGFELFLGWATAARGWSLTVIGQASEGLVLLARGLTIVRASGTVLMTPVILTMIASTYGFLGQPVEGLNYVAEAVRLVEVTDERCSEAELYRVRGDLLFATGDANAAERSYLKAIEIAETQQAKLPELQASICLGRLWCRQNRQSEVNDLISPLYHWFEEGRDALDLIAARALLDEVNATAPCAA